LKDFQPAGTTDKKTHKHQQYDLFIRGARQAIYLPVPHENEFLKATDFVVGSGMDFRD